MESFIERNWKRFVPGLFFFFMMALIISLLLSDAGPITPAQKRSLLGSEKAVKGYRVFFVMLSASVGMLLLNNKKLKSCLLKLEKRYLAVAGEQHHPREYARNPVAVNLSMLIFILIGAWIILTVLFEPEKIIKITNEDALLQNLSAIIWLIAACIEGGVAIMKWKYEKQGARVYVMLSLLFFLCAMEEISWGQRILGFDTPEIIKAVNRQEELNLHNIGSSSIQQNIFFGFMFLFFVYIPIMRRRSDSFDNFLAHFHFPYTGPELVKLWAISHVVWGIVGLRLGNLGFSRLFWKGYPPNRDDEVIEFFWALLFLSFSLIDLRLPKKP